jgi:hypothetical protein
VWTLEGDQVRGEALSPRARERKVHAALVKICKRMNELVTLLDDARLAIERNEKGEYVVTDGKTYK